MACVGCRLVGVETGVGMQGGRDEAARGVLFEGVGGVARTAVAGSGSAGVMGCPRGFVGWRRLSEEASDMVSGGCAREGEDKGEGESGARMGQPARGCVECGARREKEGRQEQSG